MSLKDCVEHLYSWDYTIQDSYGCPGCAEQERIIKLLTDAKAEQLTPEQALAKGWRFDEPAGIWWLPQDRLIALIKGENK